MDTVSTESHLIKIPQKFMVDPAIRVEIEQFLYFEASLLDERQYADWYRLMADDVHYWMPNRRNRLMHEADKENTTERELGLYDDNKVSLSWRVEQILTRKHWAEDPPSRTRHMVMNIRIEPTPSADEYAVSSNFLVYRNRLEDEVDIWVGERQDVLRRLEPLAWQIARRTIILDQSVVLSKNLSTLF